MSDALENLVSSVNPANLKSYAGMLKEILRFHDIKQETCVAATVVSYNRTTGLAKVKVLVQSVFATKDGVGYKSGDVMEVPVLRMQHGMFWVDAPLYPGDTGYLVAGHRDQSLAVGANDGPVLTPERDESGKDIRSRTNNHGPQPPNTYLLHRYENGFFIPCRWGNITVADDDKDSLIIARLKEDENTAEDIHETIGTAGKITMASDGTVKVTNGTGLVIASDSYTGEEVMLDEPQTGDSRTILWEDDIHTRKQTKKPTVYIDPTADLDTTDARFRVMEIPTGEYYTGTDGKTHLKTKKRRVLADESDEDGTEIVLSGGGGSGIKSISCQKDYADTNTGTYKLVFSLSDGSTMSVDLFGFRETTVVTSSSYSTTDSNHKFTNERYNTTIIDPSSSSSTQTVFSAVEHVTDI